MTLNAPTELRYTESHEWIRCNGDGSVTIGITAHAQDQLGDLVYVELPVAGSLIAAGEPCAVLESTKAAADVCAPIDGEVIETNLALGDAPHTVNTSPYQDGWLIRVRPAHPAQIDALMTAQDYLTIAGAT
jgi:glycine cleavage system H protein